MATLDHHELFGRATDDFHFKLSFYVGALRKAKLQGLSLSDISLDNFDLGPEFSNSMWKNQCGPGSTFAGVFVDTVSDLLMGHPKNPASIFRKSATSDEARTHGDFTGYRMHVTKSGLALRLMFWRDSQGLLVLANVGPKQELLIEKP